MEGLSLDTQESAFDVALVGTQNSHTWSETISEIGDSDLATPFLFDLDESNNKNATQTDSVISNFSDNSQPILPTDFRFNDINENQKFLREDSANSFVSNLGSPLLEALENDLLSFGDDMAESVTSSFSTQEPIPQSHSLPATNNAIVTEPLANNSDDSRLPPLSDFKFIIPTSTAKLKPIIKDTPKPVIQRMKKEGLTDVALRTILKETELHEKWEDAMNAQLAQYGNIAKVCKEVNSEAVLFWLLDSWIEGNLIFAWCTLMDEEEIDNWISTKEDEDEEEGSSGQFSSLMRIEDDCTSNKYGMSTIKSCPDDGLLTVMNDELSEPEEKFLFAFSLAYIKSRKYAKKFIEEERVVAVWPDDWSEIQITLPKIGHCIANLTSKFKADSIY